MCGVISIVSSSPVNQDLYNGLAVLQHRGQDAAGIITCSASRIFLRKSSGLVRDVFHTRHMKRLSGNMGIGHVRYPTAGAAQSSSEAQPFFVNYPYGICLAHNGNLTNTKQLKRTLVNKGLRHLNTDSDSEILLNALAYELQKNPSLKPNKEDIFNALSNLLKICKGGYAATALIPNLGVIGFRDPHGIRPLCIGRKKTDKGFDYIIASESVALDMLGYDIINDIAPGEVVFITKKGELHRKVCYKKQLHSCLFEYVYLARPDSIIDGVHVHKSRLRMGNKLAEKIKRTWHDVEIDVVIPIPDTSRTSALQVANYLGVVYREGFIKNRYIGRTFIMPGQQLRQDSVRQKLNCLPIEFKGKNVLLVDDSIVRGTTSAQIVTMARKAGAKKVYFASAAPEVKYPNVYGINMPSPDDLVASNKTLQEVTECIGADKLIFQDLEDLKETISFGNSKIKNFEASVFDGEYVTGNINEPYLTNLKKNHLKKKSNKNTQSDKGILTDIGVYNG